MDSNLTYYTQKIQIDKNIRKQNSEKIILQENFGDYSLRVGETFLTKTGNWKL